MANHRKYRGSLGCLPRVDRANSSASRWGVTSEEQHDEKGHSYYQYGPALARLLLPSSRKVDSHCQGGNTCALEVEISQAARATEILRRSRYAGSFEAGINSTPRHDSWLDENFEIPLALMTVGWDPSEDPTHHWQGAGRNVDCTLRILNLPRVLLWFTSHTQYDSHQHPKFHYLPVGFGGWKTHSGLSQSVYLEDARQRLKAMEECDASMMGRFDLIYQCNSVERTLQGDIWRAMTQKEGQPAPINHCPLPPREKAGAASAGIFAVSPPGTGPDCFRHYEMMVEGTIALVPDEYSLRSIMEGMPAFFMGKELPWDGLTCDRLLHMASEMKNAVREGEQAGGLGMKFEKLTHGYWRNHIRKTMLTAAGVALDSQYEQRSTEPLNAPEWGTYRRVGCFERKDGEDVVMSDADDQSPSSCASFCSDSSTGRTASGFFGITIDSKCWCGNEIGGVKAEALCEGPVRCINSTEPEECLADGYERSSVYVFGPSDRPLDYVYHGCFPEHPRFMYHVRQKFADAMTPTLCGAFCTSLRYSFFAVEDADWCRCGVMSRFPSGTPIRKAAWAQQPGHDINNGDLHVAVTGIPSSEAVVGETKFQCDQTCSGDKTLKGCGGNRAWDIYSVTTPCVLFRECDDFDFAGVRP